MKDTNIVYMEKLPRNLNHFISIHLHHFYQLEYFVLGY